MLSGAFPPTYLLVVAAYRIMSRCQVFVHTLPKVLKTGRIRRGAFLRACWGLQQQTAWTWGVLTGALARCLLQRHKPTERKFQFSVKNAAWEDMKGKTFFFHSPGRADFRGVGLTVFLGALWVTDLWIQGFNHCAKHTEWETEVGLAIHKALYIYIYIKCYIYILSWATTKH